MITDVAVVVPGARYRLVEADEDREPTLVPARYVTIEVEGHHLPAEVVLDGVPLPLPTNEAGTRGHLMHDLFRSVGFHQLQVENKTYLFGTDDAKLKLSGIQQILEYLRQEGLSWGSQLFFSDGTAIRHPAIDYAWLTAVAPQVLSLADAIAQRPFRRPELVPVKSTPRPGRIVLHDTIRLLRRAPRSLLEPSPFGPIQVGDQRYSPRLAVISKPIASFNTMGNRRATWLLKECLGLATALRANLTGARRQAVDRIIAALQETQRGFPFAQLMLLPSRLQPAPSIEELSDPRYQKIFEFYEQLLTLGWLPGLRLTQLFAYVKYADEIYQAFVALTLARAFGTNRVVDSLTPNLDAPTFTSETHAIYYDTVPPRELFSNWRDESIRPSDVRPDITLLELSSKRGVLLDAKYRVEPSGQVSSSALSDCHVYMHSFGRRIFGVCYPGPQLEIREISGRGNTILEISIAPRPELHEYLTNVVRPRLATAMEPVAA